MEHKNDIIFQILDWNYFHVENVEGDKKYVIRLFGRTQEQQTIYVEVTDFNPYFFVELPENWSKRQIDKLIDLVKRRVYPKACADGLIRHRTVNRCSFSKFTNYQKFPFEQLIFSDYDSMKAFARVFDKPLKDYTLSPKEFKLKLYESNIEPHLRCMHCQELEACGWIKLTEYQVFPEESKPTYSQINVKTKYTCLEPFKGKESDISPFTIAAFDIECVSKDGSFPQASRDDDKIIMIATTFSRYGEEECYYKHIAVLGTCHKIDGVEVECCDTEEELLMKWSSMIRRKDPDCITGYNIFGFDELYIKERCMKFGIMPKVSRLTRIINEQAPFLEKKLASSALGENILYFYDMKGRVQYDLMKVIQADPLIKLVSYKLDYVASYFFRELIETFEQNTEEKTTLIKTVSTKGIKEGQFVSIIHNDKVTDYEHMNGKKFQILELTDKTMKVKGLIDTDILSLKHKIYWCQVKDDVKPTEISVKFRGSIDDRTDLARYNLQDCELCNKLTSKLQIISKNIGMANVCNVPLSYLFMRGQGVKIFSLVAKKCRQKNHLIPLTVKKKEKEMTEIELKKEKRLQKLINRLNYNDYDDSVEKDDENEGYEGAIVFDPITKVYYQPIMVLDFASLYPNSMIYGNLSHECLVEDRKYQNLPGYTYKTVSYDVMKYDEKDKLVKTGETRTCTFAKKLDGTLGILPEILQDLLAARKHIRSLMATEKDPFKLKVLDGLQLAYKITANSLYGQTGASTSPIRKKAVAASTTAIGRDMLKYSKHFAENIYGNMLNYASDDKDKFLKYMKKQFEESPDSKFTKYGYKTREEFFEKFYQKAIETLKGFEVTPKVIYGDTDSIFVNLNIKDVKSGEYLVDKVGLDKTIKLGILASETICILLPANMTQEYEKTLWPLMLLSKKRYVGNLYEKDTEKYFQKSMGVVLKRRDNAQIVKIACGGIVDWILNKRDPTGAVQFTKRILKDILSGKYGMDKFIITKTFRETYKKDKNGNINVAHYVLAQRMGKRDLGNKPQSNDRIPFVYIECKTNTKLQGERIEHPDYVKQNDIKLDYLFYVTNQIMKPANQFLELVVENPEKIFEHFITREENRRVGVIPISFYFDKH